MGEQRRVVLNGNSVVLGCIGASLERGGRFEVVHLSRPLPGGAEFGNILRIWSGRQYRELSTNDPGGGERMKRRTCSINRVLGRGTLMRRRTTLFLALMTALLLVALLAAAALAVTELPASTFTIVNSGGDPAIPDVIDSSDGSVLYDARHHYGSRRGATQS